MKKLVIAVLLLAAMLHAQVPPREGDFILRDFKFKSGETLPEVKIHYYTFGTPQKDAKGEVHNAVLLLHGTTGSGSNYLGKNFTDSLFAPGKVLDAGRYFIILPDSIGHGKSSKPSDGLHARFPHYTYDDMVEAQYRLVTEHLGIKHLRLVGGISMGGMHTWVWATQHPDMMDALFPIVCQPIEIAGRNRIWRRLMIDIIRTDPAYKNGDYTSQPPELGIAMGMFLVAGPGPASEQKRAPTRDQADKMLDEMEHTAPAHYDANDVIYALDASKGYNPWPKLEAVRAPVVAVNFADDFINPPDLNVMPEAMKKVKDGKYVLVPLGPDTNGHFTSRETQLWVPYLEELMKRTEPK